VKKLKNINYKKIGLIILKILLVVIISSAVLKTLYDIGISIYKRSNNQTINNIEQNYTNDISNQNDAFDKLENNSEKWYVNAYWKFAYAVFIIYAFYTYHKHKMKIWYRM